MGPGILEVPHLILHEQEPRKHPSSSGSWEAERLAASWARPPLPQFTGLMHTLAHHIRIASEIRTRRSTGKEEGKRYTLVPIKV